MKTVFYIVIGFVSSASVAWFITVAALPATDSVTAIEIMLATGCAGAFIGGLFSIPRT